MTNLMNSTATVGVMGDVVPGTDGKVVITTAPKVAAKLKAPTQAQLDLAYTQGRNERVARQELVALVKAAHKQGRDLEPLKARFLIGKTLDAVPAIRKLRLNSYDAADMDWDAITKLWTQEAGRANPNANAKSASAKAKGGLRDATFHRVYRNAEQAWTSIRADAGLIERAEPDAPNPAPQKEPQVQGGQVNAGKDATQGNIAPNPAPAPAAPEKLVTPRATTNVDATKHICSELAELLAYVDANVDLVPEAIRTALLTCSTDVQKVAVKLRKAK